MRSASLSALFICYVIFIAKCLANIHCSIKFGVYQMTLVDNIVYAVEGTQGRILCGHDDHVQSCEKTIVDATGVPNTTDIKRIFGAIMDNIFITPSLKRKDAGNYTITCQLESRTISLHVLYPPAKAVIYGSSTALDHLTCEADSNPPARYWWKHDNSSASPVIATGSTLNIKSVTDPRFVCFAQNTLVPTIGVRESNPPVYSEPYIVITQGKETTEKNGTEEGLGKQEENRECPEKTDDNADWSTVIEVGAILIASAVMLIIGFLYIRRRIKLRNHLTAEETSVGLKTITSRTEPFSTEERGTSSIYAPRKPTETDDKDSMCPSCGNYSKLDFNSFSNAEETRRKSITSGGAAAPAFYDDLV